jgi:hypothetical protein
MAMNLYQSLPNRLIEEGLSQIAFEDPGKKRDDVKSHGTLPLPKLDRGVGLTPTAPDHSDDAPSAWAAGTTSTFFRGVGAAVDGV